MQFKNYFKLKTRIKNVIKLYSRMLLNDEIDWIKLKNVYSRQIKDNYAEFNVKKILRQRASQLMITDELIKIYEGQGITAESVIKNEKTIYNASKKDKQYASAVKILSNWRESLDMKPDKQITTQTQEISYVELLEGQKTKELKPKAKEITKSIDKKPGNE